MAKVNLFYIEKETYTPETYSFVVYHRQLSGKDKACGVFYFGKACTVSMTRAMKAAKVFCKQMNTYYPIKLEWSV
jgi:hypothetical protein